MASSKKPPYSGSAQLTLSADTPKKGRRSPLEMRVIFIKNGQYTKVELPKGGEKVFIKAGQMTARVPGAEVEVSTIPDGVVVHKVRERALKKNLGSQDKAGVFEASVIYSSLEIADKFSSGKLPRSLLGKARLSTNPAVMSALSNLEAAVEQAQDEEWTTLLDTMKSATSLDADQIAQAELHCEMRRNLKRDYTFFSSAEFVKHAPGVVNDSNPTRGLAARVEVKKNLIGMKEGGSWIFPICQINPRTGDVFDPLASVIKAKYEIGYTAWEVLLWLVTPSLNGGSRPGRPVEMGDAFDPEEFRKEMAKRQSEAVITKSTPLDHLLQGENDAFLKKARVSDGG